MRAPDPLELLLGDAPPATFEAGRRALTFARLLASDARHAPGDSARINLDRARGELEEHTRRRVLAALLDLTRHHLYAQLGAASFAWMGEPKAGVQEAWTVLEEQREELAWLSGPPEPNESALRVAERLLESAARAGLSDAERRLWAARLVRAEHGPERGEQAFRALLANAALVADVGAARGALAGVVESLLDRGAVRVARATLDEGRELAGDDLRLRRLAAWCALLQDDEAAMRAAEAQQPDWRDRLPTPLVELRQRRTAWLPFLTGKAAPKSGAAPERANAEAPSRRHFGAALLAVVVFDASGAQHVVHVDAAPGARNRVPEWLREREGACLDAGEPEHRLIAESCEVIVHRIGANQLRGSLAPATTRALALAPLFDARGALAGWLRLEFEHHLVPAQHVLSRAAHAWSARVATHHEQRVSTPATRSESRAEQALSLDAPATHGPCAQLFHELVAELAMKTAQRHWWGFSVRDGRAQLVAEGGAALGEDQRKRGGHRAALRALMSAGSVRFDEPSAELALDSEAASGVVIPLQAGRALCGLLAVESGRRKDFPESFTERLAERCNAFATELRVARFREWHIAQHGHDLSLSSRAGGFHEEVFACGRSRAPLSIVGPAGAGKQIAARWVHFESERCDEALVAFGCASDEGELWERGARGGAAVSRAQRGTLVLDDVELLPERSQARLVELIEASRTNRELPRVIATSRHPLGEATERGRLRRELSELLLRAQLICAPLSARRGDIPGLVSACARRFAIEERLAPPTFSDAAVAALWRQPWTGNVRQLENFIYKFVLLHAGREVGLEEVERLAQRYPLELLARLSSRHAEVDAVRSALETTANLRGSFNKTRAALYLGWDPDTLVTRATELGLLPGADQRV